jgi:translation initiation factor 2 alpha subunit (eIF-2alpha)
MNTNRTAAQLITSANTSNGFAIGIVTQPNRYNGRPIFSVVRMDRQSRYVTISTHDTETDARTRANREWAADRQAVAA